MQRDFELIRIIMRTIAADAPAGGAYFNFTLPGEYDDRVVWAHIELLIEAGLIEGKVSRSMSGISGVRLQGLTWAGYEFMAAAKEDGLWQKATAIIKSQGSAMTFTVELLAK